MSVTTYGWLVLAFPLGGSILIALTYKALPAARARDHRDAGDPARRSSARSAMFFKLQDLAEDTRQVVSVGWDYAKTVGIDAQIAILVDPLSMLMCLVVSGVSTLIHLYSVAYMGGDRGYTRFFAYLNFFVFSMLLLVLAANFFLLIVGWAFVGAASYFLISLLVPPHDGDRGRHQGVRDQRGRRRRARARHVLHLPRRPHAGLPADVRPRRRARSRSTQPSLVAGCILLLVGAFAKSAQVPLHTWLPDAMEGPTPVSALIHAATMVTAGVYLIARMHPLFERAPDAADVGAIVGCVTLLIAATIGLVVTDLKRVIAYSTMSQIGYMIMGVSSAAYAAGLFHLMTHAFFKALLFMAAGSVISAMGGIQDLDRMSRLPQGDAVHVRLHDHRRPRAVGRAAVLRRVLQGRDPRRWSSTRGGWHVGARRARLPRRVHDRDLHVPDDLPRLPRRAVPGGAGARARPPLPRAGADQPGDRRGRGHRRRLPRPRAPHRRARARR